MSLAQLTERFQTLYHSHQRLCVTLAALTGTFLTYHTLTLSYTLYRDHRHRAHFRCLDPDAVHLFLHPRWSHGPNFFPHCVKVETFLRLSRIPYTVHFTNNVHLSPNHRLPFLVHRGKLISDGEFILQYLTDVFPIELDALLTPQEISKGMMLKRLVETSINYGLNRTTFIDHTRYMQDMFQKEYALEPIFAQFLVRGMRRATVRILNAVGFGELSQEQYEAEFLKDIQAVEAYLQGKPFLFGERPSSFDCSVFAWLQVAGEMGPHGPALAFLSSSKTLKEYINRMMREAFPDMEDLYTAEEEQHFMPANPIQMQEMIEEA